MLGPDGSTTGKPRDRHADWGLDKDLMGNGSRRSGPTAEAGKLRSSESWPVQW